MKLNLFFVGLLMTTLMIFGACSQNYYVGIAPSDREGKFLISGYNKGLGGVSPMVWEADPDTQKAKELEVIEK